MIVAIIMPNFVITLERQYSPTETNAPIIVYNVNGLGRQVMACCPIAKGLGVTIGMSRTHAHGLCPEALERDAHSALYQHAADALCATLLCWSDRIVCETGAILSIWLDLGKHTPSTCNGIAQEILEHCRTAAPSLPSIGLAEGQLTARVAAMTGQRNAIRVVNPGQEKRLLAPLSIRLFQTNEKFQEQCDELGIKTLGELGKLPYSGVKHRLGTVGGEMHRLFHGHDLNALPHFAMPLRKEVDYLFENAVENKNILLNVTTQLADELTGRLTAGGLACGEVALRLVCEDRKVYALSRTFRTPIQRVKALCEELARLIEMVECESGIVSLTIVLEQLTPPVPDQLDFFDTLFGTSEPFLESAAKHLKPRHKDTPLLRITVLPEPSLVMERNCILSPVNAA